MVPVLPPSPPPDPAAEGSEGVCELCGAETGPQPFIPQMPTASPVGWTLSHMQGFHVDIRALP